MPVTTVGFKLRADGFFDGNPALDLPPPPHPAHDGLRVRWAWAMPSEQVSPETE